MSKSSTQESGSGNTSLTAATKASELERRGSSRSLGSTPGASDTRDVKVLDDLIMAECSKWVP